LISAEDINREVFAALSAKFDRPTAENEHGFLAFAVDYPLQNEQTVTAELVLAPHYLLCTYPFGYIRFGSETRLFLSRLDDYIACPHHALRGMGQVQPGGRIAFLVTAEFSQFLQAQTDRNYKTQFGDALLTAEQLTEKDELIWPCSRERRLFQRLAATAQAYGLPVTPNSIVLDPSAAEFIGFREVSPQGMEFRDGDAFVRFTPEGVEAEAEGGEPYHFTGSGVLEGWALDNEGRVCVLYRSSSPFVPPENFGLLRFLSEGDRASESGSLNVLAVLETEQQ
jgi:hypothetical protein